MALTKNSEMSTGNEVAKVLKEVRSGNYGEHQWDSRIFKQLINLVYH